MGFISYTFLYISIVSILHDFYIQNNCMISVWAHIFFRNNIKQYYHLKRLGYTKQYYTLFSEFLSNNTFTFGEFLPNNTAHFFSVNINQY